MRKIVSLVAFVALTGTAGAQAAELAKEDVVRSTLAHIAARLPEGKLGLDVARVVGEEANAAFASRVTLDGKVVVSTRSLSEATNTCVDRPPGICQLVGMSSYVSFMTPEVKGDHATVDVYLHKDGGRSGLNIYGGRFSLELKNGKWSVTGEKVLVET